MKKAICICGSPNRNGSSAMLLAEMARGMADAGIDVTNFYLEEMNLHCCTGCNACRKGRRCAQRDDMDIIMDALLNADVVCAASPSLWGDVTAQLKTMIDRSLPLCSTLDGGTIVPPGKLGVSIAVRAGHNPAENMHLIDTIEHYYGHLGILAAARLHAERIGSVDDLKSRPELLLEAYRVGRTILDHKKENEPALSLKAVTMEDVPELAAMNEGLIHDEGSFNPMKRPELEHRMRCFLSGEYKAILIKHGGETAGYCLFKPEEAHTGGEAGVYLRQYYIKPEFRRQGVGRSALQCILKQYLTSSSFVALDVLECNSTGKAFWSSAGFRTVTHRMLLER